MERHFTAASDRLHEYLAPLVGSVVPDSTASDRVFDRFEVILGLVTFDLSRTAEGRDWGPIGRFGWRRDHGGLIWNPAIPRESKDMAVDALAAGRIAANDRIPADARPHIDELRNRMGKQAPRLETAKPGIAPGFRSWALPKIASDRTSRPWPRLSSLACRPRRRQGSASGVSAQHVRTSDNLAGTPAFDAHAKEARKHAHAE